MYWHVNYFSVAAGRFPDYMAWGKKYHDWMKSQKGFQTRTVLHSYSYPGMYAGSLRWESREAARSALTSAEFGKFIAANSVQGIITITRPAEAYEDVLTVGDSTKSGKCLTAVEWQIDPGKTAVFEQSRHESFDLRQKLGHGFCFSRLFRLMGNPARYLAASTYASQDDAMAATAMPEFQEHLRAKPYTAYTSARPTVENYEVIPTN
jgi:heme-degrading monooxygenase HmoA